MLSNNVCAIFSFLSITTATYQCLQLHEGQMTNMNSVGNMNKITVFMLIVPHWFKVSTRNYDREIWHPTYYRKVMSNKGNDVSIDTTYVPMYLWFSKLFCPQYRNTAPILRILL